MKLNYCTKPNKLFKHVREIQGLDSTNSSHKSRNCFEKYRSTLWKTHNFAPKHAFLIPTPIYGDLQHLYLPPGRLAGAQPTFPPGCAFLTCFARNCKSCKVATFEQLFALLCILTPIGHEMIPNYA